MGPVSASLTASFNSETSREEMESRSTSNTWETTQTKMSGTSSSISYTIGDNNEPPGKYRTTLFGTTDVYLYVKIRVDHTDGWRYVQTETRRVEEAYTFACARPPNTLFWSIDYEPALDGDFGKTADTENLAIPNLDPAALPIPTIQIDG
ncbi:MAG: hypothetical protein LBH75_00965 [Treponema sp.]|jgi:hypothetical protein|nr:hypothetical protein [Treponema sp.]